MLCYIETQGPIRIVMLFLALDLLEFHYTGIPDKFSYISNKR